MGFMIFIPFMVIDLVVSAIMMSMGMYMLPPTLISLPFKILLFVLVDGWTLVVAPFCSRSTRDRTRDLATLGANPATVEES